MGKIKKSIRAFLFVVLIILAGLGIGISGAVTIPSIKLRRNPAKDKVELVEKGHMKSKEQS